MHRAISGTTALSRSALPSPLCPMGTARQGTARLHRPSLLVDSEGCEFVHSTTAKRQHGVAGRSGVGWSD